MSSVFVSADCEAGYVANIQMEDQSFVIDESGIEEGIKTGPDPNDYLLGALGACTVITLHMYAKRKDWPLDRAEVSLRVEPFGEGTNPVVEDYLDKRLLIVKRLRLFGDLSPEQLQRLEEISSRCPVQKIMEAGVAVHTVMELDI